MSLGRNKPPSLTGNTSLARRSVIDRKTTPGLLSRKTSVSSFHRLSSFGSIEDDLRGTSLLKLPKLSPPKRTKAINGVVTLDTGCERKYRAWSDPTEEGTLKRDLCCQTGAFYQDVSNTHAFIPWLAGEREARRETFDDKSFCDTVSSFRCSNTERSSMCSPDIPDDRGHDCFVSKHKAISSWIQNIGRTIPCLRK